MLGFILTLLLAADPPPAPIKLDATLRSGYAIVSATPTNEKVTIKQAEFIPVASGSNAKITFDQLGDKLIVTLPPSGSVVIYVVALMSDGSMVPPTGIEVPPPSPDNPTAPTTPTAPGTPTTAPSPAAPLAGETNLRISLVVNLAAPDRPSQDLILLGSPTAQSIKQALGGLGHSWHVADVNSVVFQQALAKARATTPTVPTIADTPFLFIERADRSFRAAFKLNLTQDPRANANAILALFGGHL